jgi:glycosyltransferase involved in cell wall biosynthesis
VTPAEAVRHDLLSLHREAEHRVHVVPHGFDPAPWAVQRESLDDAALLRAGPFLSGEARPPRARGLPRVPAAGSYVLLVGTGHGAAGAHKKGVDVFAKVFEHGTCAGLAGVVVGEAEDLPAGVHALSSLEDPDLAYVLEGARVVAVPSRSEGFGYPMLEAFAAGVPVVASAAGALPEVSGGAARLVPPGDADALRDAIARVAVDEPLRARLIKAGRRRAREFPVEAMARGWLRVLCEAGGLPCPV